MRYSLIITDWEFLITINIYMIYDIIMGKNGSPSYNDWKGYLIEHKNTGIKDRWKNFLSRVQSSESSHNSRDLSKLTAQKIFCTIRDLFVSDNLDDNYYRIDEGFKALVKMPSKKNDECLKPIIQAIADLKKEISSRPVERKCVRRNGRIVRQYGMTSINNGKKWKTWKNKW